MKKRTFQKLFTAFMLSGNIVFNIVVSRADILPCSHLLSRRNLAPNIKNLLGQLQFTSKSNGLCYVKQ